MIAALLGSGQAKPFAKRVEQRHPGVQGKTAPLPIDFQFHGHIGPAFVPGLSEGADWAGKVSTSEMAAMEPLAFNISRLLTLPLGVLSIGRV